MINGDPQMIPANDNLEIPEFLKAPNRSVDTTPLKIKSNRFEKYVPKPPKGIKWKGAELVTVWLADQCPQIGCGIRMVWAKRGHKWVHLEETGSGARAKLTVQIFDRAIYVGKTAA